VRVLLLSTYDRAGGAEKVAFDLCRSYRQQGHDARLFVRYKRTQEPFVREVDPYAQTMPWAPICRRLEAGVRVRPSFRGQYRLVDTLRRLALPRRWLDRWRGVEDFNYPYSWRLADPDDGWQPDVIHAHNLHGDYFDPRALPRLSRRLPVVWTLHDTWAFTGHCGYFVDCERWRAGCGQCPDLGRPPAIQRDGTAANWQRKREIYTQSRLAVSTPSRWLMTCVEQSMLRPAQMRVIPYGVDPDIYHPGDRSRARAILGLPQDAFVIVFSAFSGAGTNPYKDFYTVRAATQRLRSEDASGRWLLVCIGGRVRPQDDANIRYTGYLSDPHDVARYYRSADLLLHSANAENSPLVILEAMACGAAVVATGVGGIPEQIVSGETGFVAPRGDSEAMARHVLWLMRHPDECRRMGEAGAIQARESYGLKSQVESYLAWFSDLRAEYREMRQ
jgi:glycosyltransferase involved in cell wall biosynthesis